MDNKREYNKRYNNINKDKISKKKKEYYRKNRDRILENRKKDYTENSDLFKERMNKHYQKNKEKIKIINGKYRKDNRQKRNLYEKQRRDNDPRYKMVWYLRVRLNKMIKSGDRHGSAVKNLGCSIKELMAWIEKQFYENEDGEKMTWKNWSPKGWHIDHIIPLSSFDLADLKQLSMACHYTNLRPLWAFENLQIKQGR